MQKKDIKSVLERAAKWPKAAQDKLVRAAREIEEDLIDDPQLMSELREVHQEALNGDGSSIDDIKERLGL